MGREVRPAPGRDPELLPDWERNWGLPDPCYTAPLTIAERQLALVMRMTMLGAQSRAFFIEVAAQIGYTITITEYRTFVCGIDRCGDNRVYGDGSDPMFDEWNKPIGDLPTRQPGGGRQSYPERLSATEPGPDTNRFYWTVPRQTKQSSIWSSRHDPARPAN